MSYPIEIKDTVLDLRIETDEQLRAHKPLVIDLYQTIESWLGMVDIVAIELTQDAINPLLYAYRVEHDDGREFSETWMFSAAKDVDPMVTLDVEPAWRLSGYDFNRAVRDRILAIRSLVGLINFEMEIL